MIIRQVFFSSFILIISLVVPTVSLSSDKFSAIKRQDRLNDVTQTKPIRVSIRVKLDSSLYHWEWKDPRGDGTGLLILPKTRQVVFSTTDKAGSKRSITSQLNSFNFGVWQYISGSFDEQRDIMKLSIDNQGKPPYQQEINVTSKRRFDHPSKQEQVSFRKVVKKEFKAPPKLIKRTPLSIKPSPAPRPFVKPTTQQPSHKRIKLARRVRIMPLGDSITSSNAYRRLLWKKLYSTGYHVDFIGSAKGAMADYDTDHEGHSGWEAGEIEAKISGWLNYNTPDIVMLHIGTNDLTHGQSNISTLREIKGIIERIRQKNKSAIILLAKIIPIQHLDVSAFNHQLGRFATQQSTQASPIIIVDQASGYNASTDNIDGIHPNKKGEEKIANKWFATLRGFLSK